MKPARFTPYVTFDEARRHLRLDDDEPIEDTILAASAAIANYLGPDDTELATRGVFARGDDDAPAVPYEVRAATLLLCGYLYRYRDEPWPETRARELPAPVIALLYPLRGPIYA